MFFVALGCDESTATTASTPAVPPAPTQAVGTSRSKRGFPLVPIKKPKREITIRLEDVPEMEVVDVPLVDPPAFVRGKVSRTARVCQGS